MDEWIHGVHNLEVLGNENVGLMLAGQHADDFGDATGASPVVGKGMLRADAKDVGRGRAGEW